LILGSAAIGIIALGPFPGTPPAGASPEGKIYEIRFGTMAPRDSAWTEMANQLLIPLVHDMFQRKLKLLVYFNGVKGDDDEILELIRRGELDACSCTNQGTVNAVPELAVLTLPMLFRSYDEVDYIIGKLRKYIETTFEKQGFKLLFMVDTGFLYFFGQNDISTLDFIRDQKIFYWFGDIQKRTFNSLGITPTYIGVPELTDAIISGKANAGSGPASWLLATQMYPFMKYMLERPLFYGPSTGFVSKKKLNEITDDMGADYQQLRDFQSSFNVFKSSLQIDPYLEGLGIRDPEFVSAGREILAWVKQQRINIPDDVIEIFFGVFRRAEKAWLASIRKFESECFAGFFKRGMSRVRLEESEHRQVLFNTRKVWDEFTGKLYPEPLLSGIRRRLLEYRAYQETESSKE